MSTPEMTEASVEHFERIRMRIIENMMPQGKVPDDPKMINALVNAVNGGSKVAIAVKRLEIDTETNHQTGNLNAQIAEMLRRTPTTQQAATRADPNEVPVVEPRPGEIEVGTKEVKYSQMRPDLKTPAP